MTLRVTDEETEDSWQGIARSFMRYYPHGTQFMASDELRRRLPTTYYLARFGAGTGAATTSAQLSTPRSRHIGLEQGARRLIWDSREMRFDFMRFIRVWK